MAKPLTSRQIEYLDCIRSFIATNGYAPTAAEIARSLGIAAISAVQKQLDYIEIKGRLVRGRRTDGTIVSRSIQLID